MKIVLLHYSAPPVVGGVESVLGHQARLMADAGHEVRIVAGRGTQTDQRVDIVQVPMVDSRHPIVLSIKEQLDKGAVPNEFRALAEGLAKELRTVVEDADCLIAHNVCSLNKNLILTAALKKISAETEHPRFILWHHDLAWTTPRYRQELYDSYPWDLLCKAWDGVEQVTISAFRRRELSTLMNLPEEKISVIPNGVDVARFLKLETLTSQLVDQLDLLNGNPILLLPVRITARKNIELALQVMAQLCTQAPQAKLVITGPLGPHNPANLKYFEALRSLRTSLGLESAVHFLAERNEEFLPDEVVSDFYLLADALILPSREEGFGIPVLEAGLAGIPIFCADIPPLKDLGQGFVNYFSVQDDPLIVASMIWKHLSSNAQAGFRTRVRSSYAWHQVYKQQIQPLLERVCKS
ncbi:MAG TPA: glycosyltransferase family 4 protein [Anaerolineales bacterium]|nr:glycosyltransferase family 4 protein [Anaerolineales bacterium]